MTHLQFLCHDPHTQTFCTAHHLEETSFEIYSKDKTEVYLFFFSLLSDAKTNSENDFRELFNKSTQAVFLPLMRSYGGSKLTHSHTSRGIKHIAKTENCSLDV